MRLPSSLVLFGAVTAFDFEIFLRGGPDKIYTWREAKNYCQNMKDGWQLVIVDSSHKQSAVERAFVNAGAGNDDAAWIGYTNRDGWGANSANAYETLDIYGNRAGYLNYAVGQPDNKRGNPNDERGEDCVRMRLEDGKMLWEDALCGRRDTLKARKGSKPIRNSFICEPRPDEDLGACIPSDNVPYDDQYFVAPAETISYNEARESCQARGPTWDLAVFESDEELQYVKRLINCLPEAFWIGYREMNGKSIDLFGKPAQIVMPWLTNKLNGEEDEPNSAEEECVRIRNGKMNDAMCTRTWSGAMRDGIGMGYVCEQHLHSVPTQASKERGDSNEQTCEDNNYGIKPFVKRQGCYTPEYCTAGVEVIDAWSKMDQNNKKRQNYGFAAKITIPAAFRQKNRATGYSILLRFPESVTRASFQSWNFNFFNFYNGGSEVLMHSKWYTASNFDNFDPDVNSFVIIVENMDAKAHPQVLAFNGRVSKHSCFDPDMAQGARSKGQSPIGSAIRTKAQEKYGNDITLENVSGFAINSRGIARVKAKAKKQKSFIINNL